MIRNETYRNGEMVAATIIDLDADTIAFEENGVVTSTRALTSDERALYTPPAAIVTAEVKLTQARAVLDQIDQLPAPVLTADVVDLLDDLRGVL